MKCKYCNNPIRNLLNGEMQCFRCYDKNKAATPEVHKHKVKLPGRD